MKKSLVAVVIIGGGCIFYKFLKIHFLRKKYSHLPGSPTNGLE
jgi:hypothetical protein